MSEEAVKKRSNDENQQQKTHAVKQDEDGKESRRIYRQRVEQRLRARLDKLVAKIGTDFQNIHLNLGHRYRFDSLWKSPDWKAVEQRRKEALKERKRKVSEFSETKAEEVELKMPKLECQVEVKKLRSRPPPIKVEKCRPGRKPKSQEKAV
jgi:hypothetical protein